MTPVRKRYSFWINEAEAQDLKAVKEAEGITESQQLRQAIREWLKRKGASLNVDGERPSSRKRR
jgi:hypothetical protein